MPQLSVPVRDHIRGAPNAAITLLDYGDYACPRLRLKRRRFGHLFITSTFVTLGHHFFVRQAGAQTRLSPAPSRTIATGTEPVNIALRVNGTSQSLTLEPRVTLLNCRTSSDRLTAKRGDIQASRRRGMQGAQPHEHNALNVEMGRAIVRALTRVGEMA